MAATTGNLIIRLTTTVRTDQHVDGITNAYQSEKRKTGVLKKISQTDRDLPLDSYMVWREF